MLIEMKRIFIIFLFIIGLIPGNIESADAYTFEIGADLDIGAGSHEFAPFYIRANKHGKFTQAQNALLDLWATDTLDRKKRFDFSWGVEVMGGYTNKVEYHKWNEDEKHWESHKMGPAPIWIQQLYGEVKWRSLFLSIGLKDRDSFFVDQNLSSGDLLWSGNTKGIPEVRIGFIDWQTVPWTKKWLQVNAALSYGKFVDNKWLENHFDYWDGKINTGALWTYKRLELRSNPDKRLYGQFGFQMSGIFGGWTYRYGDGKITSAVDNYGGIKDFFLMLLPIDFKNHEQYKVGDHKGSWDLALQYKFDKGETLRAYTQWFWEDGSSLLKQNKWDGLWGLEFKTNRKSVVKGMVMEFLDMTHMCGPITYSPPNNNTGDAHLPYAILGRDWYYNNYFYRSYVNYGLTIGTPMVQGILFNTGDNPDVIYIDQIPYFRVRGVHIAVEGNITPNIEYILKFNRRKAWGDTNTYALIRPAHSTSFMAGVNFKFPKYPGLTFNAAFGLDRGTLPSNTAGIFMGMSYRIPVRIR